MDIMDGIDISSWKGDIDLYEATPQFCIVKATEGTGYVNPYYRKHFDILNERGILRGSYHFATPGDATEQAKYYLDNVAQDIHDGILCLDYEAKALNNGPDWCEEFLDYVAGQTQATPLIYMSLSVTNEQDWSSVCKKYPLWVANYPTSKDVSFAWYNEAYPYNTGYWDGPTIWQYSSSGWIDGYNDTLDVNHFYGTRNSWWHLTGYYSQNEHKPENESTPTETPAQTESGTTEAAPQYEILENDKMKIWVQLK